MKKGYSKESAMGVIWSLTPFPIGDGAAVMAAVKRFLRVRRKNRRRWVARQDRLMMRALRDDQDGAA